MVGNGRGPVLRQVLVAVEQEAVADPEEAEVLVRQLRRTLEELDVEAVDEVPAPTPPSGAKGDAASWGELLITLSATGGIFTTLVRVIQEWVGRHPNARRVSVTIDGDTIELDRASTQERRDLVDAYLHRHLAG